MESITVASDELSDGVSLSKRQKKRLARQKKWEEGKAERRIKEREKQKRRKAEARANGEISLGPSRKKLKAQTMKSSPCGIRVAIDVGFDHLMDDLFYLTSFHGKTKQRLESIDGCLSWDVNYEAESYLEAFRKEEIIYLTSESPNCLESLSPSNVYVIGGLIDHNKHKGLCFSLAEENGVGHARLPIEEYVDMKTRKTLAVNHVFQILALQAQGESWTSSLMNTIASRKGATAKKAESCDEEPLDNE